MDIIDNIIFASFGSSIGQSQFNPAPAINFPAPVRMQSDFLPNNNPVLPNLIGLPMDPVYSYVSGTTKFDFCSYADSNFIEESIKKHWYDIVNRAVYTTNGSFVLPSIPNGATISDFSTSSTYHLITAYLLENTRIIEIFYKMMELYFSGEDVGIAENPAAFNWLLNSENLFCRSTKLGGVNVRSTLRENSGHQRRNAYFRMLGMDLAFEDGNNNIKYIKSKNSNQEFVIIFERFLSEIWQSYTNSNNTSGVNTTDINIIVDLAIELDEMLQARRGNSPLYVNQNLSREEFYCTLITSWFTYVISFDSPVVQFLKCESSTIGERLIKIGNKVGIPAHQKCQSLFEMAGATGNILRTIENSGVFDNQVRVKSILNSLNSGGPDVDINLMTDLLTTINNWEKATGHNIKNPSANIRGTVTLQQNGIAKPQVNGTMPKPALN